MPRLALPAAALLAALGLALAESPHFHAAQCVARGASCGDYFASRSGGSCVAGLSASDQSAACITTACTWCRFDAAKAAAAPCTSDALRSRCGPLPQPTAAPGATVGDKSGGSAYYFSARCVELGQTCSRWLASRTDRCRDATHSVDQSAACTAAACRWCAFDQVKLASDVCQSAAVQSACYGDVRPTATPAPVTAAPATTTTTEAATEAATTAVADGPRSPGTDAEATTAPSPSPSPASPADVGGRVPEHAAGTCTWEGDDEVVIDLGSVTPTPDQGWERVERDGFSGLQYRPRWGHGLTPAERGGAMCFPVRVAQDGDYFWTFVSYAPHRTEHNDAWVKTDLPLRLWKTWGDRHIDEPADTWLKAYHSNGAERGMSVEMKTVDHDGHRFAIRDVKAGQTFNVCLSGRSFRFSVFRFALKKCFGKICEGGALWRNFVYNMPVSKCV